MKDLPAMEPLAEPAVIDIELPSRVDLVTVVRMIVAAATEAGGGLFGDRLDDLRLATSEATTNAIQANQLRDEDARVQVRAVITPGQVQLAVSDEGYGMSENRGIPEITDPNRLFIEGGFGVPLMGELSGGHVKFTSSESGTTVELTLFQDDDAPIEGSGLSPA